MARRKRKRGSRSKVRLSAPMSSRRKSGGRRRRRLGAGGSSSSKGNVGKSLMNAAGNVAGAALYTLPQAAVTLNTWGKLGIGLAIGLGGHYFGYSNVAGGAVGAMTYDLGTKALALADMMPNEWVDPNTLQDSGYYDESGNIILQDGQGNVFALNDDGDYEQIGEGTDLQSVSLQPLTLQASPYSLADYN